jgi:hypothetical protein
MTASESRIEKIQAQFQALSSTAVSLNTASNELTRAVGVLDEALKKLNVGLTAWVSFRSADLEPYQYSEDQIGYAKVNGTWGIALQQTWGDESRDEHGGNGPWLFNDAPRDLRLDSVDKLSDLIAALSKRASETTEKLNRKTHEVHELARAIEGVADQPKGASPFRMPAAPVEPIVPGYQSPQTLKDLKDLRRGVKLSDIVTKKGDK